MERHPRSGVQRAPAERSAAARRAAERSRAVRHVTERSGASERATFFPSICVILEHFRPTVERTMESNEYEGNDAFLCLVALSPQASELVGE